MHSHELLRRVSELAHTLHRSPSLFKFLNRARAAEAVMLNCGVTSLASGEGPAPASLSRFRAELAKLSNDFVDLNASEIPISLIGIEHKARQLASDLAPPSADLFVHVEDAAKSIRAALDTWQRPRSAEATLVFVFELIARARYLEHFLSLSASLNDLLSLPIQPDEAVAQIEFSSTQSLDSVSSKLAALSGILSVLADFVPASDQPKETMVKKIETGSLFIEISGHPAVIAATTALVLEAARYFQREFTLTGRRGRLSKDLEDLNSAIGLLDKMRAAGLDTHVVKSGIEDAAAKLARYLPDLVEGESRLSVNGELARLDDLQLEKYLAHHQPQRLLATDPVPENSKQPRPEL